MEPLASIEDLISRFRALSEIGDPSETDVATQLLSDASDLLRDARPDIDARLLAGTIRPGTVKVAICNMVKRVLANPNLLTSQGVAGISRGFMTGTGMLELLPADLGGIDGASGTTRSVRAAGYGWGTLRRHVRHGGW